MHAMVLKDLHLIVSLPGYKYMEIPVSLYQPMAKH